MKLSRDTSRSISTWSPMALDDQPGHSRFQAAGKAAEPAGNADLAESLFAPPLSDDFTPREKAPAPGAPAGEEPAQLKTESHSQPWLRNNFNQSRMMEDCCENWVPAEISYEPVGVDSQQAAPNVETIREAALSVARDAVMETMREQAEQIIEHARSQATEILMQARSSANEELRRAQQQGFADARSQAESMLEMLATVVAETQNWQSNMIRHSERMVLSVVKDITDRLFGGGFVLDQATLGLAFERALTEAKSLGDLRVRAHPDDLAMLGEIWPAHQTSLRGQHIEMIPDLDIQRGGCFIDGQFGSVDGRLDAQMRLIRERLDQELTESERPDKAFTPLSPEELTK
jgi:flagellar assembly protein FliH